MRHFSVNEELLFDRLLVLKAILSEVTYADRPCALLKKQLTETEVLVKLIQQTATQLSETVEK